ncbi:hypothetical protein [Roseitranquillus sediminis]|uniref:hypothetical protein n=1 Tax=Roseitranquillus sediminis TaxID=2809051 RepID=UPI001D0C3897|nr:hypothetical protein [Roseitranquillus sediminis]MBM9594653.1 hypothetical protein [Roseitranquillus sediminis]
MKAILLLLASAVAAPAQTSLGADAFDALTRGRTFLYSEQGVPYGAEDYLPNRRVRWSYLDGACIEGEWFPAGDMICFRYNALDDLQCWTFYRQDGRLAARFAGDPPERDLTAVEQTDPLVCPGPDLGV